MQCTCTCDCHISNYGLSVNLGMARSLTLLPEPCTVGCAVLYTIELAPLKSCTLLQGLQISGRVAEVDIIDADDADVHGSRGNPIQGMRRNPSREVILRSFPFLSLTRNPAQTSIIANLGMHHLL